jgi:hydroxymethylpyrimidine kinase / phosphomethylpyrimidine kinase / thiamine-phosphate diphosphorylase
VGYLHTRFGRIEWKKECLMPEGQTGPSVLLAIAGSDSGGGAGVQADLRAFAALGAFGASVVTAITAQNSQGVRSVWPLSAEQIVAQLDAMLDDYPLDGVKIGMLGTEAAVAAIADRLSRRAPPHVVLDPVLASTGGVPLLEAAGQDRLVRELLPLVELVTPNISEASRLSGMPVTSDEEMERAARWFVEHGARAVLVKGGHRAGAPRDLLLEGDAAPVWLEGERIETPDTHGTGCTLAAAITARLAQGRSLVDAVRDAKRFVEAAIRGAVRPGRGRGCLDPMAGASLFSDEEAEMRHAERLARLRGLYVVTDSTLRPDRDAASIVAAAIAGGAAAVQLREKRLSTPALGALARRLSAQARAAGTLFLVNDRVDMALAADADGVHVGPDDMPPADARRLLGPERLLGVSVGTVEEARAAAPYASYLGVGAIFGSRTKADAGPAVGPARIAEIRAAAPGIPVVAIGGITAANIAEVATAGAEAAAVVSAVVMAGDMVAAVRALTGPFSSDGSA